MVVLALLAGAVGLAAYASSRIERQPVDGLERAGTRMNVLVTGSDSREALTDEQAQELGTGQVGGKRADTIFVLSVQGTRAAMLSFPRDLFVTRCDGSQGRINAAFVIGDGPSCLVQTVSSVSGIPITHYLELDFVGFVDIVDALGGVPICVDDPIVDAAAAIDLPAGCHDLDGATALGFVRVRKIDDDLGRISRQQYFLQQLAGEASAPSNLLNPARAFRLASTTGDALVTDDRFGPIDMLRLGIAARGLGAGGLPTYTVPATPGTVGGASVLIPDDGPAQALYAAFRDGSVFDEAPVDESADPSG